MPVLPADLRHAAANIEVALGDAVAPRLAPDRGTDPAGEVGLVPPLRTMSRRSTSSARSRQSRSLPSALRRTRLQVLQNGSEIGEMKPMVPAAPGMRQTRAGSPGGEATCSSGPNSYSRRDLRLVRRHQALVVDHRRRLPSA